MHFKGLAQGRHFASATIKVINKTTREPILQIDLTEVTIISDKFTEGASQELDEEVLLSFAKITITHVPSGKTVEIDTQTNRIN